MGVEYIRNLSGRSGEIGTITEGRSSRSWLVKSTSRYDDESIVLPYGIYNGYFPIPYTDFHPTIPLLLCRKLRWKQEKESPLHSVVTADYSSEPLNQSQKDQEESPLARRAKIRWNTAKYQKAIDQDNANQATVNSAGDYFDPPPTVDRSRWTATVVKNLASVPSWIIDYTDAVNASPFTFDSLSVGARVAKIMSIEISDTQTQNDIDFYIFTYTLEFRPETWALKVLDQGFRYKSGSNRKQIMTEDTPPRPVTSPRLLDGSGAVLANPTTSNAVYKTFYVYNEKDFGVLPKE
jgi:hypothetical protein